MEFFILAILVVLMVLLFTRAEVEFKYERKGSDDRITFRLLGPFGLVYHGTEVSVLELGPTLESWRLEMKIKTKEEVGNNPMVDYRIEADTNDWQKMTSLGHALKGLYHDYRRVMNYALKKTTIRALSWQTAIGTGDAAWTAILSGGMWALKGTLVGTLQSRNKIADKDVVLGVFPSFKQRNFQTYLQCILSLRVVHIIGAVYILWQEKRKRRKRGD